MTVLINSVLTSVTLPISKVNILKGELVDDGFNCAKFIPNSNFSFHNHFCTNKLAILDNNLVAQSSETATLYKMHKEVDHFNRPLYSDQDTISFLFFFLIVVQYVFDMYLYS